MFQLPNSLNFPKIPKKNVHTTLEPKKYVLSILMKI